VLDIKAFDIKLRDVPEQLVVTEQRNVNQAALVEWLPGAMSRVARAGEGLGGVSGSSSLPWLLRTGHPNEPVFIVIYEGNPNEGEVPVEVCAPLSLEQEESTEVAMRRVPAHREAYVRLAKAQTMSQSKIGSAYVAVERWIASQGLEVAGAPCEVFYTDYYAAALNDEVYDVAWPIR
jgi:effector-binding domain-containing protein